MQPLTFVSGVLLGSSASITLVLSLVLLIGLFLADEPRLAAEMANLWRHAVLFLGMTVLSAAGFLGLLRRSPWRWWAQALMWAAVAGTAWFYIGVYRPG